MKKFPLLILIIPFTLFTLSSIGFSQDDKTSAETVVHLLNYLSIDYSGAVQNGKIVNEMEYNEQVEFSARALAMTQEGKFLPKDKRSEVLTQLKQLKEDVISLKSNDVIVKNANQLSAKIIELSGIQTAPKFWPDYNNGKQLYMQNCAVCHGPKGLGDGKGGVSIDPKPSNFHDAELMANFSPFQAYNSIRLGVPGTAMQSYSFLSSNDIWSLAFYVKSLRFAENAADTTKMKHIFEKYASRFGLKEVANMSDKEIVASIKGDDPEAVLAALRTQQPKVKINSLPLAKKGLLAALESYKDGNRSLAQTQAVTAYLEGIEPVEAQLKTIDGKFVGKIESQMFKVRQVIEKNQGVGILQTEIDKALDLINEANQMMTQHHMNYLLTFIVSLTIVLREALEAFLILAIVIALIKTTGAKKALPWLHSGWISAVILGILGWFLSDYIIRFGGRNREVMEGLVSLFAVAVLMYMGYWMHNQTHAQQWTKFIKEKIGGYLQADRLFGLAAFSFMVVFREAFEVVLFLQAVNLEAIPQNKSAIGFGVLGAAILITIIAYFFTKYSSKLPIKQLFKYSSWIIILLAIVLTGKGVHSLQESGWISVAQLPEFLRVEWLGIYPTLQSILSQIGLILLIIIVYLINERKHSK